LFSERPRGQVQADLLDVQIQNLVAAIHSTQLALEDIRRDDGKLKNNSVGREQLAVELKHGRAEIDQVEARAVAAAQMASIAASQVVKDLRDVDLRADDAEKAAISAAGMLSAISHGNVTALDASSDAENSADRAESAAIQSQNSANYSHAQADNAIAAKDESLQWAEYLAGPVVSGPNAPSFVNASAFPNGLFYQPVAGSPGGLWSSKWWAIQAMQLVGGIKFYLGPHAGAPVPGSISPITGETYPNPIPVGSYYYDTSTAPPKVFFWDGSSWQPASTSIVTAGYLATFLYIATAGQTQFSGADSLAQTPAFTTEKHDVTLNGVRLVPTTDFTVDPATDKLTLVEAPGAGAVIQWDILAAPGAAPAGAVNAFKVQPLTPNGVLTAFTLNYIHPVSGTPTPCNVGSGAQLQVCLDGIIPEPAIDYTATGATLTMAAAPRADAKFWAIWYSPSAP
jgi:hypothetical protein